MRMRGHPVLTAVVMTQRIGDRYREPYEQFVLSVNWNRGSDDRLQYTSGPYSHLA
jgi:hypothetical protein